MEKPPMVKRRAWEFTNLPKEWSTRVHGIETLSTAKPRWPVSEQRTPTTEISETICSMGKEGSSGTMVLTTRATGSKISRVVTAKKTCLTGLGTKATSSAERSMARVCSISRVEKSTSASSAKINCTGGASTDGQMERNTWVAGTKDS